MSLAARLGISDEEARTLLRQSEAGDLVAIDRVNGAWVDRCESAVVQVDETHMLPSFVIVRPNIDVSCTMDPESAARFFLPDDPPTGWQTWVKLDFVSPHPSRFALKIIGKIDSDTGELWITAGARHFVWVHRSWRSMS